MIKGSFWLLARATAAIGSWQLAKARATAEAKTKSKTYRRLRRFTRIAAFALGFGVFLV